MANSAQAAFSQVRQCLVVTLLGEVDAGGWQSLQRDLLERVARQRCRSVVLDASAVRVMDADDATGMVRTLEMCQLLGARGVVVGLSVPLVASLMALDLLLDGVEAASTVEAALELLRVDA